MLDQAARSSVARAPPRSVMLFHMLLTLRLLARMQRRRCLSASLPLKLVPSDMIPAAQASLAPLLWQLPLLAQFQRRTRLLTPLLLIFAPPGMTAPIAEAHALDSPSAVQTLRLLARWPEAHASVSSFQLMLAKRSVWFGLVKRTQKGARLHVCFPACVHARAAALPQPWAGAAQAPAGGRNWWSQAKRLQRPGSNPAGVMLATRNPRVLKGSVLCAAAGQPKQPRYLPCRRLHNGDYIMAIT